MSFILDVSSRLKENIHARQRAAIAKEDEGEARTVEVPMSDDEESIIRGSDKANGGACRSRESDVWWRAPKGLASDNCGTNW